MRFKSFFSGFGEKLPALPPLQPRPGLDAAGQNRHKHLQHGLQVVVGDNDSGMGDFFLSGHHYLRFRLLP